MFVKNFSNFIKALETSHDLTDARLGKAIDCERSTVNRWKNEDGHIPRRELLDALEDYLSDNGWESDLATLRSIREELSPSSDPKPTSVSGWGSDPAWRKREELVEKAKKINREVLPRILWSDFDVDRLSFYWPYLNEMEFIFAKASYGNDGIAYDRVIGTKDSLKRQKYIQTHNYYMSTLSECGINEAFFANRALFFKTQPESMADVIRDVGDQVKKEIAEARLRQLYGKDGVTFNYDALIYNLLIPYCTEVGIYETAPFVLEDYGVYKNTSIEDRRERLCGLTDFRLFTIFSVLREKAVLKENIWPGILYDFIDMDWDVAGRFYYRTSEGGKELLRWIGIRERDITSCDDEELDADDRVKKLNSAIGSEKKSKLTAFFSGKSAGKVDLPDSSYIAHYDTCLNDQCDDPSKTFIGWGARYNYSHTDTNSDDDWVHHFICSQMSTCPNRRFCEDLSDHEDIEEVASYAAV